MKILYKIYISVLQEKQREGFDSAYACAAPIHCPNFENEQEAESWLKFNLGKSELIIDNENEIKRYYFIQKTYIQ